MSSQFPVIDVQANAPDLPEQQGTKEKFWFKDSDGRDFLFKRIRDNTGEHWAEKIACELCSLLDLPHAHYDLARWKDAMGVVSPSFVPAQGRLVPGNELLAKQYHGYDPKKFFGQNDHTVKRVITILSRIARIKPPASMDNILPEMTASDVFIGYLMLDAWIGNTDRHHENWAISIHISEGIRLAPSYDHASSLGRIEGDKKKEQILRSIGGDAAMIRYVEKARSALYKDITDQRPLTPLQAFEEASLLRPGSSTYWKNKLSNISDESIIEIVNSVPKEMMSSFSVEFVVCVLAVNRLRILTCVEGKK